MGGLSLSCPLSLSALHLCPLPECLASGCERRAAEEESGWCIITCRPRGFWC